MPMHRCEVSQSVSHSVEIEADDQTSAEMRVVDALNEEGLILEGCDISIDTEVV